MIYRARLQIPLTPMTNKTGGLSTRDSVKTKQAQTTSAKSVTQIESFERVDGLWMLTLATMFMLVEIAS